MSISEVNQTPDNVWRGGDNVAENDSLFILSEAKAATQRVAEDAQDRNAEGVS